MEAHPGDQRGPGPGNRGCAPNISQTGGAALCLAPDPAGLLSLIVCWLLVLHLVLLRLDDMVTFLFSVPYSELLT